MSRLSPAPAALTAAVLAVALSGCALLKSPDPVQLYRFGMAPSASADAATTGSVSVAMRQISFPDASATDRILGVTGSEAAYIGGARWVSDARTLFTDSLTTAFAEQGRTTRIIGRQELTPAGLSLDIDVTSFEARYDYAGAAPQAVITARGRVLAFPSRAVVAERTFAVAQPAGENRIGAIVAAFDTATRDINSQIVAWTEQTAASRPAAPTR